MLNSRFPIALYWGPELALLYNDAWSPIPGEKHPWALGRPGREVWPEIWDAIGPLYERVIATGEGVWQEDELLPMHRHGYLEECYYNFTFSPIAGEDGRVEGIFNAVVETTEQVLSARRLRTLSRMGERADATLSVDGACRAVADSLAWNAADIPFALIYFRADDDLRLAAATGLKSGSTAAPPEVQLESHASWPFAQAEKTGAAVVIDAPDGVALETPVWPEPVTEVITLPVVRAGEAQASAFLVAGVNPRRRLDADYRSFFELAAGHVATAIATARAYEEARERADALAEIDRAKTAFFSNISHEFRTPLTLMLGPLEDALRAAETLPVDQRDRLDTAHRNAQRLLRLVNALLDFSRMEAGRAQARFVATDLGALTADLASSFRSATDKAGLSLKVDAPSFPQPVYVDQEMWEKIVLNLLSNAFKFTFEGEIGVSLREVGEEAQLTVSDTGVGIPAQELPRLFERFHRVDGVRGRSFEGSGIGLALVQDLVKQHGGEIAVASEEGRGTCFTVSLPLGRAHLPQERIRSGEEGGARSGRADAFVDEALRWLPDDAARPSNAAGSPTQANPEMASKPPARIVLADDNADLRSYITRILTDYDYEVEAVGDGQAALDAVREHRPDVVVTDVMMPRLDGFGLLRAIRADPTLNDVPVIMLSARAGEEASVEGLEAGADDYLTKPFSARELVARVAGNVGAARQLAHRRRAEAELQQLNETLEERVATEIAQRMEAEDALRQAQKMEAVGHLTGGVAHDFNNLLTVIIGGLDTIRRAKPQDEVRVARALNMATQGAERAAALTSRLLAFSRKQPLKPVPADANLLVRDMTELLHRTLGEQVELEGVLAPRLWSIEVDTNQLESVILNLAVNARDAMPDGGKLTIETSNTMLDESYVATDAEVIAGQYVAIAVSDTGEGMSKAILSKVFEPFFTTKEVGRGTGLGLSMVYGFVKQSGGHVTIYSEEGQGTTVKLYFPRFMGDGQAAQPIASAEAPAASDGEVVFVVEDNADVRAYSVMILAELGYQVLEAEDAEAALKLLKGDRHIDLLFTDVVLPGKSGRVLADSALALRPDLTVLFTTGYSRNAIVHHGRLDAGVELLTKPFTFEQLATKVRDLLDAAKR